MKSLCFFGIYDRTYSRNAVIAQGLEKHGYNVIHCNIDPRMSGGLKKYFMLIRERMKVRKVEFIFVAFPGHTCVLLEKILFPRTLIVFDVFLSLRHANAFDRKVYAPKSLKGLRDFILDWHSIRAADVVIIDTYAHMDMFVKEYGLSRAKAKRVLMGSTADMSKYRDIHPPAAPFIVHYHGSFIPQHGVEYMLDAAQILKNESGILFRFIGGGQARNEMQQRAKSMNLSNVEFVDKMPFVEVMAKLAASHVSLGMFGKAERAQWVIINKVVESAAMGKAIITQDSPAMREVFTDGENVLLTRPADGADLADKIKSLKADPNLRIKLGKNAQEVFERCFTPEVVVKSLLDSIGSLV